MEIQSDMYILRNEAFLLFTRYRMYSSKRYVAVTVYNQWRESFGTLFSDSRAMAAIERTNERKSGYDGFQSGGTRTHKSMA